MENIINCGLIAVVGKKPAEIALRAVSAKIRVNRNVCHTTLQQHYVNMENVAIEAVYSFPLPMEATVTGMQIIDAERVLEGVVMGREAAFDEYDSALGRDLSSYLLDQDTPNHFTCSVGNLAPGQDIVVSISYVQFLCPHDNIYRLCMPSLIAEVYTPAQVLRKMDPSELDRLYPPRSLAKLPYGLELDAEIMLPGGIKSVDSPSHTLKTVIDGDKVQLRFSSQQVQMDRDFVANIEAKKPQENLAYLCPDPYAGGWIGYAEFMPALPPRERKPLDIIYVVDCSGSMQGDSIEDAKNGLLLLLASLQTGDKFNIIAFGSSYHKLSKQLLDYNDSTLGLSRKWVSKLSANMGGTEILAPLKIAVQMAGSSISNIILLTDGQVGNNQEILKYINKLEHCPRFYSIGVGHGADEELLRSLASVSGGGIEMVYPGESMNPVVGRHFARMNSGNINELYVDWGGEREYYATQNTALIPNTPVIYMKHFDAMPRGREVCLNIVNADAPNILEQQELEPPATEFIGLPQLYAKYLLTTPHKIKKGSQQPQRAGILKQEEIAITYQILSADTSFVITDPRRKEKLQGGIELRRIPVKLGFMQFPSLAMGGSADLMCCNRICNISDIFSGSEVDKMDEIPPDNKQNSNSESQLIMVQTASGYWEDESLLTLLNYDNEQYQALHTRIRQDRNIEVAAATKVAITVIVVEYLQKQKNKPEYQAMLFKAVQWLQGQGIDSADYIEYF